jgi:transcription factor C subunit 6
MDDNFALKGIPIRRFFTTISLGRARSVGTALATSLCHPFVLMGTAHGEVTGSNPTRRIVQPKAIPLLQTWFGHEWRRPTEAEASGAESSNPEDERIGPHGLTRFIEGYKIEQGQRQYREGSMQNSDDKEHGLHFHTVHEEATAVTSLAWNPNRECGAWAVAGMADGLVRVEDLAAA